ncbi:MAG: FecR domain-containing protein [Bacteroidota bacterium]
MRDFTDRTGPPPQDDALALYDTLPPDDRAVLLDALRADPELATAFQSWRSLRADVRRTLSESLPDRTLLVLHALADQEDVLRADEHRQLEAADLQTALDRHPALVAAVRRIRADRDAFEAAWAEGAVADTAAAEAPALARRQPEERPRRAGDREMAVRPPVPASRRASRWIWRTAAVAVLVTFAALSTWLIQRDAGFDQIVAEADRSVVMPDGSVANLAAGAVLMVPTADRDSRQARLKTGSALFQIVPDADAPFRLQTANADITVLGTTFGVEASEVQTEVALVAGSVSLAPRRQPDAAVRLQPGQSSRVLAADAPSAPEPTTRANVLAWTGAVPTSGPAGAVAERIGTQFGVSVAVDDALMDELVAGRFDQETTAYEALNVLALALGANVETSDSTAYRLTMGR